MTEKAGGEYKGACACGAIRFNFKHSGDAVGFCHCRQCRQWGGGMPLANVGGEVKISAGEDSLKWWKSSPWGERGFCAKCGSSLFWRAGGVSEWGATPASLENFPATPGGKHIYVDNAGNYYQIPDDGLERRNGAEHTASVLKQLSAMFGEGFIEEAIKQVREHNGDEFADRVLQIVQK